MGAASRRKGARASGNRPVNRSPQFGEAVFVASERALRFQSPLEIAAAYKLDEVLPCLERIESAVAAGAYAAGFLAYEAAPAFDDALVAHPGIDHLPLAWFGLYDAVQATPPLDSPREPFSVGPWTPLVGKSDYTEAIHRIRDLIAAGDTYQVNYTFPMRAAFSGDVFSWFLALCRSQGADHAAFVDAGRYKILSASPELFFRLEAGALETRPMKGTRPRGRWPAEDRRLAAELAASAKDRAENVMIVDLLRNDVGRISETGSVRVPRLFDVERYETVWQMTSTIAGRTSATITEIMAALFPCGSVTGAPKVRTMQIIRELEPFPRGVYCGSIGWCAPGKRAEFNVAIRTVTLDTAQGRAYYNVGGGITWGSTPEGEYDECRTKAAVLSADRPEFELLESLLYDGGYFLLEEHLGRLAASAEYFRFAIDLERIKAALLEKAARFEKGAKKVRLLAARDGALRVEAGPATPAAPIRLGFAREPVDEANVFLYHKTTHRAVYERAKAGRPDCDDVLLWNGRSEITETTTANVILEIGGEWLTPPVSSGLLAGTMRAHLLGSGGVREAVLTKNDVVRATAIRIVNSVRKQVEAVFVDAPPSGLEAGTRQRTKRR